MSSEAANLYYGWNKDNDPNSTVSAATKGTSYVYSSFKSRDSLSSTQNNDEIKKKDKDN